MTYHHRAFGLLVLLACFGCEGAPPHSANDAAAAAAPSDAGPPPPPVEDAGPPDPAPCELAQLAAMDRLRAHDVLATPETIWVANAQGLWRSGSTESAFARETRLPALDRGVFSLATFEGAIFASVDASARIFETRDRGASWTERPLEGWTGGRAKLFTDGSRLIASGSGHDLFELDPATMRWSPIHAEPPEASPHFTFDVIGFDRGAVVANDVYGNGMVRLERNAPRWERINGLGEWGYYSFATRGDVRVTANARGLFADAGGTWRLVAELPTDFVEILDAGDRFLAFTANEMLSSSDGVRWDRSSASAGTGGQAARVSRSGSLLVWLGADLRWSEDDGASWREASLVSERVEHVALHEDAVFATTDPGRSRWRMFRDGAWAAPSWGDAPVRVGFTDEGVWLCDTNACAYSADAGEPIQTVEMPATHRFIMGVFPTASGLFVAPASRWDESCYATVQPGLIRVDRAAGTWSDASSGLPSDPLWEGSPCAGQPVYWSVLGVLEVGDVLLASVGSGLRFKVLRSLDGGSSWQEILDGDLVRAATETDQGAFALLSDGELVSSNDGFASVQPVNNPPAAEIADLVSIEGRLVVGTSSQAGTSLWVSADGARSWSPAGALGPIADLDVHGRRLAVATRSSGVWEASGCF